MNSTHIVFKPKPSPGLPTIAEVDPGKYVRLPDDRVVRVAWHALYGATVVRVGEAHESVGDEVQVTEVPAPVARTNCDRCGWAPTETPTPAQWAKHDAEFCK